MASELLLLGGAGVAAVVIGSQSAPAPLPTNRNSTGGNPLPGVTVPGSSVRRLPLRRVSVGVGASATNVASAAGGGHEVIVAWPVGQSNATGTGGGSNGDPNLQGKLDTINAAAKQAYDQLSDDAKAKGAAALNDALSLDPPLDGSESWDAVGSVVGGSLGAAAGAYIGGPIGAKLGALVGAYLGVQLADLLSKNWDDLKSWVSSKWGDIEQAASDAYNDAKDTAEQYASDASDYIGGMF